MELIIYTCILPYRITNRTILHILILLRNRVLTIFARRSGISKDITKYSIIIICTRTLSYKRKRDILNSITSLKCTKPDTCYALRHYNFEQICVVFKCRCRNSFYGNTANIGRYPHCSAYSIISANGNRRRSAIRKVGRLVFLCPICVYCGIFVQRCGSRICSTQGLISKPTAKGVAGSHRSCNHERLVVFVSLFLNRISAICYVYQIISFSVVVVIYNKRTIGLDCNGFSRRRNKVSKVLYSRCDSSISRTSEVLRGFQRVAVIICILLIMIYNVGNIRSRCPFSYESSIFRSLPSAT